MVTLESGLIGGLVATIVMTIFMLALGDDSPPPTALFWSQYIGADEPSAYVPQGMVLHAVYGIVAGAVFAVLVDVLAIVSVHTLGLAIVWGLAYGVLLFIGAAVFWMNVVLDIDAEMSMVATFFLFHLIYGLVLGAWIGIGPVF